MADFYTKHEIYINHKKVPLATEVSFENIGIIQEVVTTVEDPYEKDIDIVDYTAGRVTFKAPNNDYSNDPIEFLDAMGFRLMYNTFNTSTGSFEYSSVYDFADFDISSSELCSPKIPIEVRQLHVSEDVAIASGGTYTAYAIPIRMPAEIPTTLKLKCREASDSDVTSVDVELYEDDGGEPAASPMLNTTTLSPTINPANGATYASAAWLSIDISTLFGTASPVPGTTYWIVITATDADNLYLCYSADNDYTAGPLLLNNGSWISSTTYVDPVFIYVGKHTYGGHTVTIKSYDATKTYCRTIDMKGCKVMVTNPNISSQRAMELGFEFKSYSATITYT